MDTLLKPYEKAVVDILYAHREEGGLSVRGLYNCLKENHDGRDVPPLPTFYRKIRDLRIGEYYIVEIDVRRKNHYLVKLTEFGEIYAKNREILENEYQKDFHDYTEDVIKDLLEFLHELKYYENEFDVFIGISFPIARNENELYLLSKLVSVVRLVLGIKKFYSNLRTQWLSKRKYSEKLKILLLTEISRYEVKIIHEIVNNTPEQLKDFVWDLFSKNEKELESILEYFKYTPAHILSTTDIMLRKMLGDKSVQDKLKGILKGENYNYLEDDEFNLNDSNNSDDWEKIDDSKDVGKNNDRKKKNIKRTYIRKISLGNSKGYKYPTLRFPTEYKDLAGRKVLIKRDEDKIILKIL